MTPEKCWWTAAEIAAAGLPDMPITRQGVELLAKRLNWRGSSLARRRAGRGGGWEYSWQLFPMSAQKKLLAEAARERAAVPVAEITAELANRDDAWTWFEAIEGVRPEDRLPYLAPRHSLAPKKAATADMSPEFFDYVKSDFLRPAGPTLSSVYRRAVRVAAQNGWAFPPERTLRRRFDANISKATIVLARKGIDALKAMYPPQTRDKTALHAMEAVNADFHRFDVFVRWPAEPGQNFPAVVRPQMVAFQDIHSGRILSWRIDQTPNTEAVRLAAGDMLETYGIPEHVLLDNGREFASKFLTGGAPTRYRFRVREDDLPGLFVSLRCEIHWATPYAGQSKPIERAFRDMCDAISKDPRFDGAYTGPGTDAKPEDYGSRAVELEDFLAVLGEGIEEHNTRVCRRSEVAFGRSFADVFDASYEAAPIRKATDAQRRYWLMGAEGLRADSKTGVVRFQGNEYWAEWMSGVAGDRATARFDPAALWDGLHIYSADNAYLGHAPCKLKSGFLYVTEARSQGPLQMIEIGCKPVDMKSDARAPKTRAWEAVSLSDIIKKIAGEAGLKPVVSASIASAHWPYLAQKTESNLHFLTRIATMLDATAKPAGASLVVQKRGEGLTAAGDTLTPPVINLKDMSDWRWSLDGREIYRRAGAELCEQGAAQRHLVTRGSGNPCRRLRHPFSSAEEATRACEAALSKSDRSGMKITVSVSGFLPSIMAGTKVTLSGLRPELNGDWHVKRATHSLTTALLTNFEATKGADV